MNAIEGNISIRPVSADDKKMVFEWRNTPFLVERGSSGKTVSWEEHSKWFDDILEKRTTIFYIINLDKVAIGQIRYDLKQENTYAVSIYLLEKYTGKGIGGIALKQSLQLMIQNDTNREFVSFVKVDNKPSRSFFRKMGFEEVKNYPGLAYGHVAMKYNPRKAGMLCSNSNQPDG